MAATEMWRSAMGQRFSAQSGFAGSDRRAHVWLVVAAVAGSIGCRNEVVADPDLDSSENKADGAVIVGGIDWSETAGLPAGSAERDNSRAVGLLDLPATGGRCTAFLIAPDVVMTNQHCITRAADAAGARVFFNVEQGSAGDAGFACDTFLGNDATLDFALLQCAGRPGDTQGVLELVAQTPVSNAGVYVIHQNCDWFTDPSCAPTKKYSPGRVTSTQGELGHDADTLGGSSGSPVFSASGHSVVALHHVGVGGGSNGRGTVNRAVKMGQILPVLAQRFPGLTLGAQTPAGSPGAPVVSGDGYEPNNSVRGARAIALPFSSSGAGIASTDVDAFTVLDGASSVHVELSFSHSAGDLDLYLLDVDGNELARSTGTTDLEVIDAPRAGPVVVAVVGYQGAVGSYTLHVE